MDPNLFYRGKILVVDDELANVQLLEKILMRSGFANVSFTTDSRRVAAMVVDDDPDLLLLDLNMPHPDGYKVLGLLRELVPQGGFLPVIVLTADITPEAKHRALGGGATDFLSKPFDHAEVVLRVQNALRTRFLHRQMQQENAMLSVRTELLADSVHELERTQRQSGQ